MREGEKGVESAEREHIQTSSNASLVSALEDLVTLIAKSPPDSVGLLPALERKAIYTLLLRDRILSDDLMGIKFALVARTVTRVMCTNKCLSRVHTTLA